MPAYLHFALLLFSFSCRAQCGEEFFIAHINSALHLTQLRPGDKLVFEYVCQTKNFEKSIQGGLGKRDVVLLEVDAGNHAFYLSDEALQRAKVFISSQCQCSPREYEQLKGTIEGHKTAPDQWEITIHLTALDAKGNKVIQLNSSGIYKL